MNRTIVLMNKVLLSSAHEAAELLQLFLWIVCYVCITVYCYSSLVTIVTRLRYRMISDSRSPQTMRIPVR